MVSAPAKPDAFYGHSSASNKSSCCEYKIITAFDMLFSPVQALSAETDDGIKCLPSKI